MKAILLDMDGVILRTAPIHFAAYRSLFTQHGVVFSHADYLRLADGRSRDAVIRAVLGESVALQPLMDQKAHEVTRLLKTDAPPIVPGFLALIDWLDAQARPYAVATSSRSPRVFLSAAKLLGRFKHIAHRGLVSQGKPAPDVFLLAAKMLNVPIKRCVVIEDSPAGVEAARRAGATVYALCTTVESHALSDADRVFSGHAELLKHLRG